MSDYLLSVVIPTRNRLQYLEPTLRTIVGFADDRVEVVIEDNSDSPSACRSLVEELGWPHVSLRHSHESRSQTDNSEAALARATGQYVCFIGDDDCITRSLVELVDTCSASGIEAINFRGSHFYWPDVVFKKHSYPALSIYTGPSTLQRKGTREALRACLSAGAADVRSLPHVYHGVVSRRLLDAVRAGSTRVFPGPSPDMASAVSLSLAARHFYTCDLPVFLDGVGYHSAGGRGARGEHKARLEEVDQLPVHVSADWEPRIPRIWLGPTIWAQSCVTALRSSGREDLVGEVNWIRLYARILAFHPDCRDDVMRVVSPRDFPKVLCATVFVIARRALRFIQNGLYARFGRRNSVAEACPDIQMAVSRVDEVVSSRMSSVLRDIEKVGRDSQY